MNARSNHDLDDLLAQALADLDPAPPAEPTADQRRRAEEGLARILATDPGPGTQPYAPLRPHRRRRTRGVLLVAAALALTFFISTSGLVGGGPAYASWTAVPTPHPAADQERIAQVCRDQLSQGAPQDENEDGIPTAAELQASDLLVADSRGAWSYVLLSGANGLEASCLVEEGSRLFGIFPKIRSSAGSYGFMSSLPEPAPREIIGTGLMAMSAAEGSYWSTEGYVGNEVAAVSVLTASGTRVEATVTSGRFAAWWPQGDLDLDVDAELDSVTYIVTLSDGTELPGVDYDGIGPHWQE